MARPKYIEDRVLLELIKKYFYEECNANIKKLKASEIVKYINCHGYPDYPATTLRRTPAAMEYIEELKKAINDDDYITIESYRTIDAAALVDSNRSRDKLISAITERDCYYKKIADSAFYHIEKYKKLKEKYEQEKENTNALITKITELENLLTEYKTEMKILHSDLSAYKSVIETYVYPEIANELLIKEGAIRKTETLLKDEILENNLITSTTNIKKASKMKSNVIKGLFDELDK